MPRVNMEGFPSWLCRGFPWTKSSLSAHGCPHLCKATSPALRVMRDSSTPGKRREQKQTFLISVAERYSHEQLVLIVRNPIIFPSLTTKNPFSFNAWNAVFQQS